MKNAVLLVALFALCAFAHSREEFLALLDKYLSSPVEIDFEQRTFWHVRERESRLRGKIILGTNDRFNIVAGRMQFVSDGNTYWEYNNRQRQVRITRITPDLPLSIPTQILRLLRNADLVESTNSKSFVWQDQESRRNGYNRVEIFYAQDRIVRIVLNDTDQNVITYTFDRTVFLPRISNSVFVFTIPQGAQVHED